MDTQRRDPSHRHARPTAPTITFAGAAGTVTGSKYLIETDAATVLVDAGLYQGTKKLRLRNWERFPVEPATIDAVVLTHAHLDHCGYLPLLVADGFTGPVFCSAHTAALAGIVLPDSGHLQEEEADYANRKGFSKHHPAMPLYTEKDARAAMQSLQAIDFGRPTPLADGLTITLEPAGHILGSAIVHLDIATRGEHRRVTFSGDLGRPNHPLLRPPSPLGRADIVVIESTYGDRVHDDSAALDLLAMAIQKTVKRGGVVVIPAFAVDRTEVILAHLRTLRASGAIPRVPIYVDSPMALRALDVYRAAIASDDPEVRPELQGTDPFDDDLLEATHTVDESIELDQLRFSAIIVSASGMATGGRVLHHLKRYLPDHRATVILVGFQAQQTRGRDLIEGARQIKMLGHYIPVHADIVDLPAFSVHADRNELVAWLATADTPPETVFITHGEPAASESLQAIVSEQLGWNAVVPRYLERVRLD